MKKNYILLGPPGAGKGTQGPALSQKAGIPHISTGDMLRQAMKDGSELGKKVKLIVDSGQLVSDDLMISLIAERLSKEDCQKGFILDGFPRTILQAESLDSMLSSKGESLTHAILFDIKMETLMSRLEARRKAENRVDDSIETQKERLRVYELNTAPLISFYENSGRLLKVDSEGTIDQVTKNLFDGVGL